MDPEGRLIMPQPFKARRAGAQSTRLASSSFPAASPAPAHRQMFLLRFYWRLCACSVGAIFLVSPINAANSQPIAGKHAERVATVADIAVLVEEAARRCAIPPAWIRAVMQAESGGDARALSAQGAMGLMQIMPGTWAELRLRYGLGADPYDPHDNITAGAAHLREMHDRYGESGFLAAYNAGPDRYKEHVATGRPLPAETVSYMAAVASLINGGVGIAPSVASSWASSSLFVMRGIVGSAPLGPSSSATIQLLPACDGEQFDTTLTPRSEGMFARMPLRGGQQ
jgi:transglycosylase-like protein with SLT domain